MCKHRREKRAKGKGVRTTVLGDEGAGESKDIDDEEEDEEIETNAAEAAAGDEEAGGLLATDASRSGAAMTKKCRRK
jgi:hypothetical protein